MKEELSSTTKGKNIFGHFFQTKLTRLEKVDWLYNRRGSLLLGRKSRFTTYVKTILSNSTIVHCFIYRFAFCAKVLSEKMLVCFKRVIKLINFVKASAVITRLFK